MPERERSDGSREVLAYHWEGKYLNSPNDVCVHSSGAIYFSDPWYERFPDFGIERERELGWQGVFRIPPGGGQDELELILVRTLLESAHMRSALGSKALMRGQSFSWRETAQRTLVVYESVSAVRTRHIA